MNSHEFLVNALIYFGSAVGAVLIFQRFGLGSVLGYLAAGSIIGPWGFKWITNVEQIMTFAELGIVLLLFIIGLELSPRRLWIMRRVVFGYGGAQVFSSSIVLALIAWLCGVAPVAALICGVCLALSSTAFALQILGERNQLRTKFGKSSFGILLFQDLAAIPLLAVVPLLSGTISAEAGNPWFTALKIFGVILILLASGRFLLQPALRLIGTAHVREIFTSAALLLIFGIALVMESIGVSMALGAFIAGVVLADSEHRHELEADIEPFKGLLLGLFFISVGMSVDYGLLLKNPAVIFLATAALILVKSFLLYALGRFTGLRSREARAMAVTLSQGGEFAFVVFGVAVTQGVLDSLTSSYLVLIVTLSMAATPLIVLFNEKFLNRWLSSEKAPFDSVEDEGNQIIIAGFGRMGQIVGRILRVLRISFTALDHDQEQVDVLRKFGSKVYYGDASRLELLEAAGAARAKYLVVAIDKMEASVKIVDIALQHFPHLKIFARARNRQHAYELLDRGVQIIHRETFGSSLDLSLDLLTTLGFAEDQAKRLIKKFRSYDEEMLLQQFRIREDEQEMIRYSREYAKQLADLFESDQMRPELKSEASL